jgi:hypothetical protein
MPHARSFSAGDTRAEGSPSRMRASTGGSSHRFLRAEATPVPGAPVSETCPISAAGTLSLPAMAIPMPRRETWLHPDARQPSAAGPCPSARGRRTRSAL